MLQDKPISNFTHEEALKLLPYIIRDLRWKNGYLKILANDLVKGKDINKYLDFGNQKDYNNWIKSINVLNK